MIAGLALFDTINMIKSKVVKINVGLAASMASFLLASGDKGRRLAMPHSRVMIHQVRAQEEPKRVRATTRTRHEHGGAETDAR